MRQKYKREHRNQWQIHKRDVHRKQNQSKRDVREVVQKGHIGSMMTVTKGTMQNKTETNVR